MASIFTPQKKISYNKALPYNERLEEDATNLLAEIKFNLGRAVIFKELTPGVLIWWNRLTMYVSIKVTNQLASANIFVFHATG